MSCWRANFISDRFRAEAILHFCPINVTTPFPVRYSFTDKLVYNRVTIIWRIGGGRWGSNLGINLYQLYGGPNPPLYKSFAPLFYKTFAPLFYNLLHSFTICSTLLQFAPLFYNLLHSFAICSTLLQLAPLFYNLLHAFTSCSTLLQFAPLFYNFLHSFTISSTILQFTPLCYNLFCKIVEQIVKSWSKL